MTITLDTQFIIIIGVIVLIAVAISGGKWGCRTLSGCLVGIVCIVVGLVLLGMSGWMGG